MSQRIVDIARAWKGTPYRKNHYPIRGEGCDCASFLLGVMIDAGLAPIGTPLPAYAQDRHLHRTDEAYLRALMHAEFSLISPSQVEVGDLLLFVMGTGQPASHSGIVTEIDHLMPSRMVHAYSTVGKVSENRIDARWLARLRFAFRFPT